MYSTEALKEGIEKCKANIATFETAIQKERDTINEYYGMINVLDSKRRLAENENKISIVAE